MNFPSTGVKLPYASYKHILPAFSTTMSYSGTHVGMPPKKIVIKYLKNENQDLSNQGTSSLKSKHSSESYEKV